MGGRIGENMTSLNIPQHISLTNPQRTD